MMPGFAARAGRAVTAFAFAQPAAAATDGAVGVAAPVGTGDVASVVLSLLLVLGTVMLCGWLWSRGRGWRGAAGEVFSVIATQPLGPRERIVVIEVAGKQLVVGMTATQINTLHVFDEPVVRRTGAANGTVSPFAARLRERLRSRQ